MSAITYHRQHTEKSGFFLWVLIVLWVSILCLRDASALSLRLDERLSANSLGGSSPVPLVYESQAVSDRLRRLRDEILLREREHEALSRHLAAREKHIASLQKVIQAHNDAMAVISAGRVGAQVAVESREPPPRSVITRQIPAQTSDWIEGLLWQIGGLFLAALVLSLALYLRSHDRARRLSAVDREVRSIMRERDDSRAGADVTQAMMRTVKQKSAQAVGAKKAKKDSRPKKDSRRQTAGKQTAQPGARLKEIDVMIAFEDYSGAAEGLNQLVGEFPQNPEVHLRLLHVQSVNGDEDAAQAEERVLAAMMDGPLSDTMRRVRHAGSQMMPGHSLFSGQTRG